MPYIQSLGLSPAAWPPRGETPRMGFPAVAARLVGSGPNQGMELTGAHSALDGHKR